jgi:hypothetical protein
MKSIITLVSAGIFSILLTFTAFAVDKPELSENTIKSLMNGINSENFGLRISCAEMLGEYKVTEAVNNLLGMLHSEETEEARIVAALSLYKIGTGKALYALKRAAIFDESTRVRKLCAGFYRNYKMNETSEPDNYVMK